MHNIKIDCSVLIIICIILGVQGPINKRKVNGNPMGEWGGKSTFKEKYGAKLEFPEGWGSKPKKKPFMGEV